MTYEANLDEEMHKPWPDICGCGLLVPPEVCKQGRGCPMNDPITEPGPLANLREVKPASGTGIARGAILSVAIAMLFWLAWEFGRHL